MMNIDPNDPIVKELIDKCIDVQKHCLIHNLPPTLVLMGVAWNVSVVIAKETMKAYEKGRADERSRIFEVVKG